MAINNYIEITCIFGKNKGKTFKCIPAEFEENLWVMDIDGNSYIFTSVHIHAESEDSVGQFAYGYYKTGKSFQYGWGSIRGRNFYKPII